MDIHLSLEELSLLIEILLEIEEPTNERQFKVLALIARLQETQKAFVRKEEKGREQYWSI